MLTLVADGTHNNPVLFWGGMVLVGIAAAAVFMGRIWRDRDK